MTLLPDDGLFPVFQPIVDLREGTVIAHEALIRGPEGSPMHMPLALFRQAGVEQCLTAFELRCADCIVQHWGPRHEAGQLFVNMSAEALIAATLGPAPCWLERTLAASGTLAAALVMELTEHSPIGDFDALRRAVRVLHGLGAQLALDDFGEGHSNLRLWAELKPDIVKIDKFFTVAIASRSQNVELVRTIVGFGEAMGTRLVAEGIENADDLRVLRDLGIGWGQGYLLGRPDKALRPAVSNLVLDKVRDHRIAVMPQASGRAGPGVLRSMSVIQAPALHPMTSNDEVSALFLRNPDLHALAVVDDGQPVALINRRAFMNDYARLYFREVHGRRSCLGYGNPSPRVVALDDNVEDLIAILMSEDQSYLNDGFIVAENGRYVGLGTGDQLVRSVTEARIEAARHANPLTFLPGNIPISIHIDRLLLAEVDFVACYADLNNFKAFNDHYGYWRGDEMIRMLARLVVAQADPLRDFVGHVGGDDFMILFQSTDWQRRCARIVEAFAAEALTLYDAQARTDGGIEGEDRHGVRRFFACTTLSIGAVRIAAGAFRRAEDVAKAAALTKHDAKLAVSGLALRDACVAA